MTQDLSLTTVLRNERAKGSLYKRVDLIKKKMSFHCSLSALLTLFANKHVHVKDSAELRIF